MRAKKAILLVAGVLVGLIGLAAAPVGGFLTWAYATQREDGFVTSPTERLATGGFALVSEDVRLRLDATPGPGGWVDELGDISVRIRVTDPGGDGVFVGIAPAADVARYLQGVRHSVIREVEGGPLGVRPIYRHESGGAPPTPPGEQVFWAAEAVGAGTQTLTWDVRDGDWAVVVMAADGSRGVAVEAAAGIKAGFLLPLGLGLLIGGLLVLALGTGMVVAGAMVQPPRRPEGPPEKTKDLVSAGSPKGETDDG